MGGGRSGIKPARRCGSRSLSGASLCEVGFEVGMGPEPEPEPEPEAAVGLDRTGPVGPGRERKSFVGPVASGTTPIVCVQRRKRVPG